MPKHRALIIGAGRMGAGYNFGTFPFIYDHASTYLALKDRVELVGFVEMDYDRAKVAKEKYNVQIFAELDHALRNVRPTIISVCTPDETHADVFIQLRDLDAAAMQGVWMEKPFKTQIGFLKPHIQVNYCRRFDKNHQRVAQMVQGRKSHLFVWAREDVTTKCHFEDLARWWGSELHYMDNTGEQPSTNSYRVECGKWAVDFRNGGVEGDFMIEALRNLLDVVDGVPGAVLLSPPYLEK